MNKTSVTLTAAVLIGLGFIGCGKSGEEVTVLKLAHGLDTTHPVHKAMVYMAELVSKKSEGRLRIDIYPSEQLGSERECIEQLQIGGLAMTKTSSAPLEGFLPQVKVFSLPYLFRDEDHYWKILNGPIGKELLAAGQDAPVSLKGLCYYDAGARSFYTTKKPIHEPADLRGLKVRVQKSPMAMKLIDAMGGAATPIDWGELYTSLQQGVVDGAENNPPSFYTSLHYEICRYYTLDEHTRPPDVLLISTPVWNRLSPEFKRILQEAADESVPYQRKLWKQMVAESLTEVKKSGVEIIQPDKEPFREAAKSMWSEFEGTEVGELAARIEQVK
jgi:tripartite ATP-independent transporter DctP family solute receptor